MSEILLKSRFFKKISKKLEKWRKMRFLTIFGILKCFGPEAESTFKKVEKCKNEGTKTA